MKKIKYLIVVITLMMLFPFNIYASEKVNIHFFYSGTCTFCAQQRDYLEEIKEEKNLDIFYYDLSNRKNDDAMLETISLYNINDYAVPFTVIGNKPIIGFVQTDIDSAIASYTEDDPRLLTILSSTVRLNMDSKLNQEKTDTTAMLIFFGVIVVGLVFLLKPEKKRG